MPFIKTYLFLFVAAILFGCGSGLCPLGSAYRTNCPIAGGGTNWVSPIGVLDTSFNVTGTRTTAIGVSNEEPFSVAVQSDGKILVAGYSTAATDDLAIVRYNSNGSLDTSFNSSGIVTTAVGANNDWGRSLAVQPDGKILLGGYARVGATDDFALARYNSNGSLDTSFNTTGLVTTAVGANGDYGYGLVLQPDGKILLGGYARVGATDDFALARYNSDGSLDTSFNTTGLVTTNIGGGNDVAWSTAIQSDGKIVLAGTAFVAGNWSFAAARYNTDGSLDTSFNGTGTVVTAISVNEDAANSVAIQADGKILLGGYLFNGSDYDFALARYNSSGSLDTSFNTTGIITVPIGAGNDFGQSLSIQQDNKILIAGFFGSGISDDFVVIRYNTNGSIDTSFGVSGIAVADFAVDEDRARNMALQNDGKILVVGRSLVGIFYDFAIARFR